MKVVIEQVRVKDLQPGDVIDGANHKYVDHPVWVEVVEIYEEDGSYYIKVTSRGQTFSFAQAKPLSKFDLISKQTLK